MNLDNISSSQSITPISSKYVTRGRHKTFKKNKLSTLKTGPQTDPQTVPQTVPQTDPQTTFIPSLIYGDYMIETTDKPFFETVPNLKKSDFLTSEETSSYDKPSDQVIN